MFSISKADYLTKVKNHVFPIIYTLRGRTDWLSFSKALLWSDLFRIWTRVTDSISYNDNHFAKYASNPLYSAWKLTFYRTLLLAQGSNKSDEGGLLAV